MNNRKPEKLAIPPLRSGGVMLGYGCNLSCRHCSYRSGPDVSAWMDEDVLESALDTLAGERALADLHIGGGEPTLKPELLKKTIALAKKKGIRLSYLETNGFFAETAERARDVLLPLKEAGLGAILVSVSPYHSEGQPFARTLNCLSAGLEIFGEDAVFPWLGHFIPMLSRLDADETHTLKEFLAVNGLPWGDPELLRLFPLTPGGRVPAELRDFFDPQPAEAYRVGHCVETLMAVSHFHVDPHGYLFTGHCPGIVSARIPDLHREMTPEDNPVFVALAFGGPYALMEIASRECGFVPDPAGYISPCDLCFQVRKALFRHAPDAWPELGPAIFYRD